MNKILCFGELLLRMSPALHGKWIHDAQMPVYVGGAELNVATAMACWQLPVKYVTALPKNYLSDEIVAELDSRKIDSSAIHFSGERVGIYFLPQGADLKHTGVVYDRAGSSFSDLKPGVLDWDDILKDVRWFHFSAISPALTGDIASVCEEAIKAASAKNIRISIDLNYRAQLWQMRGDPRPIIQNLVQYCDVVMGNIWSANALLGIEVDRNLESAERRDYLEQGVRTALSIRKQFPKSKTIAQTFRFDHGGTRVNYYGLLFHEDKSYSSREFTGEKIIDKVGSGDCFMAGLIYGFCHRLAPQDIIDFASSAAFGKFYEMGDSTRQTVKSIQSRI
ncbi:MAG: carbohydrate kinase [Bacteroidetes bacterium]|nr:MAG: carbohydrate kinase [Bacteroidota bacterium]